MHGQTLVLLATHAMTHVRHQPNIMPAWRMRQLQSY